MGFFHHTTAATEATGLMVESARVPGNADVAHPVLPVTDLSGLTISTALIDGRPPCHAEFANASDELQPGRTAATPSPASRCRIVKGQDH
jgi:hypothetical protein